MAKAGETMTNKPATQADLHKLETATADAVSILAGLLAEAAGARKTAYHLSAAIEASKFNNPNPLRDRLLRDAYRLVLTKALTAHSDDAVLLALHTNEFGEQQKH